MSALAILPGGDLPAVPKVFRATDYGKPGEIVLVTVDTDLAYQMRGVAIRAACYTRDVNELKTSLEHRRVIVTHLGAVNANLAQQAARYIRDHYYPEAVGVLDLCAAMQVDPDASNFLEWHDDASGMGRFGDNGTFTSTAETRTKWLPPLPAPTEVATRASEQSPISFKLITTKLSTIKPEPVEYLVEGYIFKGKVNQIAGPAGRGKSTLIYDQVASHTLGKPAFGLNYRVDKPFEVLVFAGEEYFADTIVPRLLAVGANLDMVISIDGVESTSGDKDGFHFGYMDALRSELKNNPNIGLVLMDPITSLITGTGANQNDEGEVRALLEKLKRLAEETGVTFQSVKNFNKDESKSAAARVSGTHAYVDVCRANYIVDKDPDDSTRRIFSPIKVNGPDEPSSFAFRLQTIPMDEALRLLSPYDHLTPENRLKLASQLRRPVYEGKTNHTADDLLKKHVAPEASTVRIKAATEWLKSRLEQGPAGSALITQQGDLFLGIAKPSVDADPEANKRQFFGRIKWWRESVLKRTLGGSSRKYQGSFGVSHWFFTLPGHEWPPPSQAIDAAIHADNETDDSRHDECNDGQAF